MLDSEWDGNTNSIIQDKFAERVSGLQAFKAEQDVRKSQLPDAPGKYELKLPDDFKLPAGVSKFEFNKDDPFLADARTSAHASGMDQATFSKMLGIYAAKQIADATTINNGKIAERAKLGASADQRISAVQQWTQAKLGPQLSGAIDQMLVTAQHVEAFEKIINLFTNQGGSQVPNTGRVEQQEAGKIPGYETMSFTQRRAAQMNLTLNKSAGGVR